MLILQHLLHLCIILHQVLIGRHGDVLSRFLLARTSPTPPNQLCGADKNDLNANKERRLAAAAGHSWKSLRRSEAEARAAGWGGHTSPAIASSAAVLLYSSVSVSVSAPSFFTASARFSPFTLVSITNSRASALRWLTMASSHRHATTFPVWF